MPVEPRGSRCRHEPSRTAPRTKRGARIAEDRGRDPGRSRARGDLPAGPSPTRRCDPGWPCRRRRAADPRRRAGHPPADGVRPAAGHRRPGRRGALRAERGVARGAGWTRCLQLRDADGRGERRRRHHRRPRDARHPRLAGRRPNADGQPAGRMGARDLLHDHGWSLRARHRRRAAPGVAPDGLLHPGPHGRPDRGDGTARGWARRAGHGLHRRLRPTRGRGGRPGRIPDRAAGRGRPAG